MLNFYQLRRVLIRLAAGYGIVALAITFGWPTSTQSNLDGSVDPLFGHVSCASSENVDAPIGFDNGVGPGAQDSGQPGCLQPRRIL